MTKKTFDELDNNLELNLNLLNSLNFVLNEDTTNDAVTKYVLLLAHKETCRRIGILQTKRNKYLRDKNK